MSPATPEPDENVALPHCGYCNVRSISGPQGAGATSFRGKFSKDFFVREREF